MGVLQQKAFTVLSVVSKTSDFGSLRTSLIYVKECQLSCQHLHQKCACGTAKPDFQTVMRALHSSLLLT